MNPMKLMLAVMLLLSTAASAGIPQAAKGKLKVQPARQADPSAGLSDEDVRNQARAYLGTIDTPITDENWRGLGPRVAPFLEETARNADEFPTRRARAVDGLAALKLASSVGLVRALAGGKEEPPVLRFAAVRGLGRMLPKAEAEATLRGLLSGADDSRVRAVAGETLVRANRRHCALVLKQQAKEGADVRGQFEQAIEGCAK